MTTGPEALLAVDRAVRWPESSGVLRRVAGPAFTVEAGEGLSWFDPLDGVPEATSEIAAGTVATFATAVEWPEGYPDGLSGAAVGLGDPAAVVSWDATGEFSVDRGVGCVVLSRHVERVARDLQDFANVRPVLDGVRASMVHPLAVGDLVVGVAFHCGMGSSTNRVHEGRDASGTVVALLADLDLLTRAELEPS
jgi:hypothetical protein